MSWLGLQPVLPWPVAVLLGVLLLGAALLGNAVQGQLQVVEVAHGARLKFTESSTRPARPVPHLAWVA